MARYLVTGGAGFIGSHLVDALVRRGHAVRVVDDFSTGSRANLQHVPGVDIVPGDLAEIAVAQRATQGVDCVLHQAAIASVPRSVTDPIGSHRANVMATLNVLVASRQNRVRRVVFAGSSAVYGDDVELPARENARPSPQSPYAIQKLAAEQYCRVFTRLYGLDTVVLRYFNVFGPRQDPGSPYSGVISRFADALFLGAPLMIYGDGHQSRDFTYVADVVDGVLRAAETPGIAGQSINLATGSSASLLDVAAAMSARLGEAPRIDFRDARAGDVRHSVADISKATTLLGYRPQVTLAEGLAHTLAWYERRRPAA